VTAVPRAGTGAWTQAGAEPVAPGVYRIPLPLPEDGLRAVNVYAIEDGDGLALVDGGWSLPESMAAFETALAGIGHEPTEVRQILVTHTHRDHYTQAIALRRRYGSQVLLGAGERDAIQAIQRVRTGAPVTALNRLRNAGAGELADRLLANGQWEEHVPDDWQSPDRWVEAGELALATRTLTAIPTPGHTRGHLVFLDPGAGLLFAGDHVLPHITPSIGFELEPSALPLGEFLDSLRLVGSYPDARLLPAHGPVADSVHARVGELLTHHEVRLAEAAEAVRHGAADGYQVAQLLTWTRRHTPFTELSPFNQLLAVLETGAHLDLLVSRGRLASSTVDELVTYRPVPDPAG
jgi:glyoxylase-like metal-dependent hydrolase (beta-lactamase superfamily II)